jgi:hypothetical protein
MTVGCSSRGSVDRHFAGSLGTSGERELRAHLPGCDACRERYERHLLLARLDRSVASAEDRLARGLGLSRRRPRARWLALFAGLAAVSAAMVLVLRNPEPGYLARGGPIADPDEALDVYRIGGDGTPRPVLDGVIHPGDELAFAYRNRRGWSHVMVFAVDQTGRVYWYHPGWTDAAASPTAVPIEAGAARHEIPDAVAHRLAPGRIWLHALFSDEAPDVRAVERGLRPDRREELVIALDVIQEPGRP